MPHGHSAPSAQPADYSSKLTAEALGNLPVDCLTIRQYLAAKILQGMLSNSSDQFTGFNISENAVYLANCLLKELASDT